jgi:hypothetical protein
MRDAPGDLLMHDSLVQYEGKQAGRRNWDVVPSEPMSPKQEIVRMHFIDILWTQRHIQDLEASLMIASPSVSLQPKFLDLVQQDLTP